MILVGNVAIGYYVVVQEYHHAFETWKYVNKIMHATILMKFLIEAFRS